MTNQAFANRLRTSDLVYVGDYHTCESMLRSFHDMVAVHGAHDRGVALCLEHFSTGDQGLLESFRKGRLSVEALLARTNLQIIPARRELTHLLKWSVERNVALYGIDAPPECGYSTARRDRHAAAVIARARVKFPDRQLWVLMGELHLTPSHLPREVDRALGGSPPRTIVYQLAEAAFWKHAPASGDIAICLDDDAHAVFPASPVAAAQSFLDTIELSADDECVPRDGRAATGRALANQMRSELGLTQPTRLPFPMLRSHDEPSDLAFLDKAAFREHILSRESAYFPKENCIYLASRSLNHLSEEVAHYLRSALGPAQRVDHRPPERFFATVLEEAFAFWATRLVNPKRQAPTVSTWRERFEFGNSQERSEAAYVLALLASEDDALESIRRLVPSPGRAEYLTTAHALGYRLGDLFHRAFVSGAMSRDEAPAIFLDSLRHPTERYLAWVHRFRSAHRIAA